MDDHYKSVMKGILADTTALKEKMYPSLAPDCHDALDGVEQAENSLKSFLAIHG